MQVTVKFSEIHHVVQTLEFSIVLQLPCLTDDSLTFEPPKITDLFYQIGDPAVYITFSDFISSDLFKPCIYDYVYSVKLVSSPLGGGTMADYISLDSSGRKFSIKSEAGTGQAQTIGVILVLTISSAKNIMPQTITIGKEYTTQFKVEYKAPPPAKVYIVDDNLKPDFNQTLSTFSIDMSATPLTTSYDLGALSDFEGDPLTVTFSGTSLTFLQAVFNPDDGTI